MHPQFVLDSSIALAWCFADEKTSAMDRLLDQMERKTVIVPSIWPLEISNIVGLSLRKGRITEEGAADYFEMLDELHIVIDKETASRALTDIFNVMCVYKLTAYDAAYLELAQRLHLPLASKDVDLCCAAKKAKVALIECA